MKNRKIKRAIEITCIALLAANMVGTGFHTVQFLNENSAYIDANTEYQEALENLDYTFEVIKSSNAYAKAFKSEKTLLDKNYQSNLITNKEYGEGLEYLQSYDFAKDVVINSEMYNLKEKYIRALERVDNTYNNTQYHKNLKEQHEESLKINLFNKIFLYAGWGAHKIINNRVNTNISSEKSK